MSAETKLFLTRLSRPLLAWYFAILYGGSYAGYFEPTEHAEKQLGLIMIMVAAFFFGEGAVARFGLGEAIADRIKKAPTKKPN